MKLKADCYGRVPFRPSDLLNPDFDRAAAAALDTVDARTEALQQRVLYAAVRSPYVRGVLALPPEA